MEHDDIESQQENTPNSQQSAEQTREEHPRNRQKPPPICFVTRLKKCYSEFRSKLDAISVDYYLQFTGDKTLVYYKNIKDYTSFIKTYRGALPFFTYTPRTEKTYVFAKGPA